jgi:hypothetical protein
MSWLSPKHLDDASRILRGVALVLAKAAIDRWGGIANRAWLLSCIVLAVDLPPIILKQQRHFIAKLPQPPTGSANHPQCTCAACRGQCCCH